jgi:hypothetical protein
MDLAQAYFLTIAEEPGSGGSRRRPKQRRARRRGRLADKRRLRGGPGTTSVHS